MALRLCASDAPQAIAGVGRLDTFADNPETRTVCQIRDHPRKETALAGWLHMLDKSLVDLDDFRRNFRQIRHVAVAAAKFVDCNGHAELAYLSKAGQCRGVVGCNRTFGEFQFKTVGAYIVRPDQAFHPVDKVRLAKIFGPQVDRHSEAFEGSSAAGLRGQVRVLSVA